MIRLLKYEVQRKWKMSLGCLVGYFLVYFGFLLKFKSDGAVNIDEFPLQLVFFVLLGGALSFGAVIGAVNNLRIEAKESTRDLYFSIPMSAYTKIGSKVIISGVEVLSASFLSLFTAVKAIEYLTGITLWNTAIKEIMSEPFDELMFALIGNGIYSILMILVVYLSFAIFRSFFSQIKFGGLITIGIYVVLNYILIRGVMSLFSMVDETLLEGGMLWLLLAGFAVFTSAVFLLVGFLFEKRVSFD